MHQRHFSDNFAAQIILHPFMSASALLLTWKNPVFRNLFTFFAHPQSRAVGLVFAVDSLLFGSWVSHIPWVKEKLHLNDGQLGLVLFAMPAGLFLMNPMTGFLIGRYGASKVTIWSGFAFALAALLPINAPSVSLLAAGLFVLGMTGALLNVAMNTCATEVEQAFGQHIMSSCHGMWSLGGMLGAAGTGLAIWMGMHPSVHMLLISVLLLLIVSWVRADLSAIPKGEKAPAAKFGLAKPTPALILMIITGLCIAMGEGLAFDWSAIYLKETAHASPEVAALGFAGFAGAMTLGRFVGDTIIPRWGGRLLLRIGAVIAAAGLLLAYYIPTPSAALTGFMMLGLGCSLGAPILYAASMRLPGIPPATGLATYATLSFMGFLAGPPLIGFVAQGYGLSYGLLGIAVLQMLAFFTTKKI